MAEEFVVGKEDKRIFTVVVDDEIMAVYDRPNHEHEHGKMNGCPATWWLKMDSYEDIYDEDDDELIDRKLVGSSWEPWIDLGNNRPAWGLSFIQKNKTKFKWDSVHITGIGQAVITCNKVIVARYGFNDLPWAMAKAQVLMMEMMENTPFDFTDIPSNYNTIVKVSGCECKIVDFHECRLKLLRVNNEPFDDGGRSLHLDVFDNKIDWF